MSEQLRFDGRTFDQRRDGPRLTGQLVSVWGCMRTGSWQTLGSLAFVIGGSEAGISARLRDLRKERFGAHVVERRYVADGLWEYRLVPNEATRGRLDAAADGE